MFAIPAKSESIGIGRRFCGSRAQALINEIVFCLEKQLIQLKLAPGIGHPSAHSVVGVFVFNRR
jgi:hypothetical protein